MIHQELNKVTVEIFENSISGPMDQLKLKWNLGWTCQPQELLNMYVGVEPQTKRLPLDAS